ncbi:MAG: hypothetical protein M1828_002717 [Chrysothrix sp. TS-e1954]|nr:MAG: hypothetical protein M1828_002717 [Chrysothrix sp. TS-e1954]
MTSSAPATPEEELRDDSKKRRYKMITLPTESVESYRPGGLHPIDIGDRLKGDQYRVLRKLGYGSYSTAWLARDERNHRYVALKVIAAAPTSVQRELKVYDRLRKAKQSNGSSLRVPDLLDRFEHQGPNGRHQCVCFEVLGPSVATLMNNYTDMYGYDNRKSACPVWLARSIIKQLLQGVHAIHEQNLAHGDLQPGNILTVLDNIDTVSEEDTTKPEPPIWAGWHTPLPLPSRVEAEQDCLLTSPTDAKKDFALPEALLSSDAAREHPSDGGTSLASDSRVIIEEPPNDDHTNDSNALVEEADEDDPDEPRLTAPVIRCDGQQDNSAPRYLYLEQPLTSFAKFEPGVTFKISDFGAAMRAPELVFNFPFDQRSDIWSFGCLTFEILTMTKLFNIFTFGPLCLDQSDDDHLVQMHCVLGSMPGPQNTGWVRRGRYIGPDEEVIRTNVEDGDVPENGEMYKERPLDQYFREERIDGISDEEATQILAFLRRCLQYGPDDRATAADLLKDPWMQSI